MLTGIHPLLTGPLLARLDALGHGDAVVVADAHFPAARLGRHVLDLPGAGAPELLAAVRTVVPADDEPALDLMATADGTTPAVHDELVAAAGVPARLLERHAFYAAAAEAELVVRTGETRTYANALLRKGVVR